MFAKFIFVLLLVSQTKGFLPREEKSTVSPSGTAAQRQRQQQQRLDFGDSLNKDRKLSPEKFEDNDEDNGFIEVKESDIPEGAMVYVLEEPEDKPTEGETLQTASNIVFRPLFRYRGKQEAQRRNSRIRRRYFVPRRSYRHTYGHPYYYQRYYY